MFPRGELPTDRIPTKPQSATPACRLGGVELDDFTFSRREEALRVCCCTMAIGSARLHLVALQAHAMAWAVMPVLPMLEVFI